MCDLNASLSHIDLYLSACYLVNGEQTRQAALGQLPLTPSTNGWERQALLQMSIAGHYLSWCISRSMSPYGDTSLQWVKCHSSWSHWWLTHWRRDKMAAIFQSTFSNWFSLMKMYQFRSRFHWSLFPRVQLTIFWYNTEIFRQESGNAISEMVAITSWLQCINSLRQLRHLAT